MMREKRDAHRRLRLSWCGTQESPTTNYCTRFSSGPASKAGLGGVPREQKMLKGHLPRVIYHQVY